MNATHVLENIPPAIQQRFNIGTEAKAEPHGSIVSGHLIIETKDGGEVQVNGGELVETGITIRAI
jgi:hypothetical protein